MLRAAREAFLAETGGLAAGGPAPPTPSARPEAAHAPRPAGPVSPEALAAAEERLARHVGPIARVLVAQAAREAGDVAALAERLAGHIGDPAARKAFLAEMRG